VQDGPVGSAADDGAVAEAGGTVREERVFDLGLHVALDHAGHGGPRRRFMAEARDVDGLFHEGQLLRLVGLAQPGQEVALVDELEAEGGGDLAAEDGIGPLVPDVVDGRDDGHAVRAHGGGDRGPIGAAAQDAVHAEALEESGGERLARPRPALALGIARTEEEHAAVVFGFRSQQDPGLAFVDPGEPEEVPVLPIVLGHPAHLAARAQHRHAAVQLAQDTLAAFAVDGGR
jgi:hypothetical protein